MRLSPPLHQAILPLPGKADRRVKPSQAHQGDAFGQIESPDVEEDGWEALAPDKAGRRAKPRRVKHVQAVEAFCYASKRSMSAVPLPMRTLLLAAVTSPWLSYTNLELEQYECCCCIFILSAKETVVDRQLLYIS